MVENNEYFVRRLEKSDRDAFCSILRQHRIFGTFYESFQENNMGNRFDEIVWEQFKEALIFVVCSWKSKEVVGCFDIEGEHTSGTQITFKFEKDKITDANAVLLTRDMCNWIGREYNKKALFAYVNSDFERRIFNNIGYENIDEGVLVTLPL